jgi:hypothetical protein
MEKSFLTPKAVIKAFHNSIYNSLHSNLHFILAFAYAYILQVPMAITAHFANT